MATTHAAKIIPLAEALSIVNASIRPLGSERIRLEDTLGRVLAEDVVADMDMPPFDKSIVDGYACRRADLEGPLRVLESIAAGYVPTKPIGPGECSKIMTGAMIPDGADCVFMVEKSAPLGDDHVRFVGERTGENVTKRAGDMREGDVLQHRGAMVRPQDVAVLGAMGYAEVEVAQRPRVAVIGTGDELVEPQETPKAGQIRNSNSYQLCAQSESAGCPARYFGIARDTEESLLNVVGEALDDCDVLLLSGGVSMGDFDLVPGVLKTKGFVTKFEKIAVKPGKPAVFGVSETQYCFGLPGNPVSGFVVFELLVRPLLTGMMGHEYTPKNVFMPLAKPIRRKGLDREAWLPVRFTEDGKVEALPYGGSAQINALCPADGLVVVPVDVEELPAGQFVHVRLI